MGISSDYAAFARGKRKEARTTMKRNVLICAALAVLGLALARLAWAEPPPYTGMRGSGSGPGQMNQNYLPTSPPLTPRGGQGERSSRVPEEWRRPQEDPDINRDLLVTPEAGPWMILIHAYDDPSGPSLARALALELRGPNYGLKAYVWNYNDDERKAALERARQLVELQKQRLKLANLQADVPIRVPRMLIRVQCAVLVGGYNDRDAALEDLKRIRKLKPLDAARFHLPQMFTGIIPEAGDNAAVKNTSPLGPRRKVELVPTARETVNPFLRALPVHNPTVQVARVQQDIQDLAVLERLNADESFNLLKCPKSWTLAVKQFALPSVVESKSTATFLQKIGLGGSASQKDSAKESAHNLAALLRKGGWEAYVLHTRFCSIVTVGAYDSEQDPRIVHDQGELAKLNERLVNVSARQNIDLQLNQPSLYPVPYRARMDRAGR